MSDDKYTWDREEFKGRDDELETRQEHVDRTGSTLPRLSNMFSRYADLAPQQVRNFGRVVYFSKAEMDDFVAEVARVAGNRSNTDVRRADLARLLNSERITVRRMEEHKKSVTAAERDLAHIQKQIKRAREDLQFLEMTEGN